MPYKTRLILNDNLLGHHPDGIQRKLIREHGIEQTTRLYMNEKAKSEREQ